MDAVELFYFISTIYVIAGGLNHKHVPTLECRISVPIRVFT